MGQVLPLLWLLLAVSLHSHTLYLSWTFRP